MYNQRVVPACNVTHVPQKRPNPERNYVSFVMTDDIGQTVDEFSFSLKVVDNIYCLKNLKTIKRQVV